MKDAMKKIKKSLKKELDKDRYEHTLGVMYTAGALAMANGTDIEQAMMAGLLHDCAKCIPNEIKLSLCKDNNIELSKAEKENPYLIHAKLGAFLARRDYEIDDEEICHAIAVHTTGAPEMNLLDKIIFVADYIEPNRNKADHLMQIRQLAFDNLDKAVFLILRDTLAYLEQGSRAVDPMTKQTYDYYEHLLKQGEE